MGDAADELDEASSFLPATNNRQDDVDSNDYDAIQPSSSLQEQDDLNNIDTELCENDAPELPTSDPSSLFLNSSSQPQISVNDDVFDPIPSGGEASSSPLGNYFSVSPANESFETKEEDSRALTQEQEASSSALTPITPKENYFPPPIAASRDSSPKRSSLSEGDLSPYEHVDLVERLSLSSDIPAMATSIEDVNAHEYPHALRKNSQDLGLSPSREENVDVHEHSYGNSGRDGEPTTSLQNSFTSTNSDDVEVTSSPSQTEEKRAPVRSAPSRQAPAANAPRRPAPEKKAAPVVFSPPAQLSVVVDLRSREESLPPPPPAEENEDRALRSSSILPPPDSHPDDPIEENYKHTNTLSPAPSHSLHLLQTRMASEDDSAVTRKLPPPLPMKAVPPPPPTGRGAPPPPPVQVKVSAPPARRREGGITGGDADFQKTDFAALLGVSETRRRGSSCGSENGDDPPPPPRVPGPKPPPRKSPGDHSTPTRQEFDNARAGMDAPTSVRAPLDRAWTSPPRQLDTFGEEGGPSFANSLPHNFEAVSNQVGVGIRQTKSMTLLLKSILEIQREATMKIMALIEKEQRKQFTEAEETVNEGSGAGRLLAVVGRDSLINPRGKDGMDRFAKVYDKTIGFLAQEAADQLQHVNILEKEVVGALLNHNQNNGGRLNALAQTEKSCRESMTEVSKQVKKAQENCEKLLEQAIQARIKDSSGPPSPLPDKGNNRPSSLRSKVNQVSQKISTGHLQKAQKMALTAAEAYELAVGEANSRQKQFHSHDLPSLFSQLEALERTRLNDVSKILVRLMEIKINANEPRVQSCNRLLLDSKDLDGRRDMMDFLQKWIAISGSPPPPVPFSYQCQCTPNDISRGRFENTSSYFRDTLANVLLKQQAVFPEEKVPHLVEVCIKALAETGGFQSEGIFRISIPKEELEALIKQIDGGDLNVFVNNSNPHAPAALLKQWLRLLDEPVIPPEKYAQAVHLGSENSKGDDPEVMAQFLKELPQANQDLLRRITHGLVVEIIKPENVEKNRMSVRNLAIVFSPGFLRNSSDDPMEMLNSQRFEQSFTTKLFECLLREKHS